MSAPALRQEKDRDRDRGERADAPPARQTSEERRAMIASWNAEKEPWRTSCVNETAVNDFCFKEIKMVFWDGLLQTMMINGLQD